MTNEMELMKKYIVENIEFLINNNELDEAMNLIDEYANTGIKDIDIYSIKSVVFIKLGNIKKAKEVLKQGIAIDNENFDLNYNLGYLYEQEQRIDEAVKYYKLALKNCWNDNIKENIESFIKNNINVKENDFNKVKKSSICDYSIKKVLFIQSIPDIRTNKIAQILYDRGIQTDIMYLAMHPKDVYKGFKLPYKNIFRIEEINKTIKFINESDYDILFSCNEPDYLSTLLANTTNKPIIHDSHDMMSLRGDISIEQIIMEYLANSNCDGNVYVTELVESIAKQKFNIDNKPKILLDNYILKNQFPTRFLKKLSALDNEIHCVYEGGLTDLKGHHRNIQNIFIELAKNKIHVHYYAPFEQNYYRQLAKKYKYLHYEETKEPNELIEDMTKYDVGLAVLNVTERNKGFLDTTFPNKAWEYLAASLPILFSDLLSFNKFLEKYNVGEIIDLNGDLKKQVQRVKEIHISKEFLEINKLFMDDFADNLIEFLGEVKYKKSRQKSKR